MTTAQRVRRVLMTGEHEQDNRFQLQEPDGGAYVTLHLTSQQRQLARESQEAAMPGLFDDEVYRWADVLHTAGFAVALRRDGQGVVIDIR